MKIEKLKQLNALLGSEIILTGSCALAFHGLNKMDDCKDLDILMVKPSDTTKEVLKRLQKDNPSPKWKEGDEKWYSFIYDDVKVDVWLKDNHSDKTFLVTEDGVKVASISSIVAAKKSYNRPKDWVQLMVMAQAIFNQSEFKSNLSNIAKKSDDEYDEETE